MKLNIGVTIDASKIATTINGYEKALLKAVEETGLRVDRLAKSNIRELGLVDTGRLRASMHVQRPGEMYAYQTPRGDLRQFSQDGTIKTEIGKFEVVVGTNVEYALVHELGGTFDVPEHTRRVKVKGQAQVKTVTVKAHKRKYPARPYLGPAYDKVRKEEYLKGRLKKHFEDASK